jgi:hypothetical protein
MTLDTKEQELKDLILNLHDKYEVTFMKADGTPRTMRVSKIAQAKEAERLAVEREQKKLDGTLVEKQSKPKDENLMTVLEMTDDGKSQWRSFDLRKVSTVQEILI